MIQQEQHALSSLAKVGLKTLLWCLGISIIFFVPFLPIGLIQAKGIVITLGAAIGALCWLLDSISKGRFLVPRGITWMVLLGVVLTAAIASFFTSHPVNSFIGGGFEFGTITTLSLGFIYYFLFSVWSNGINFTKHVMQTFFITGSLVILFTVLQTTLDIVGRMPKFFISLGNANLLGTYNDLAIFLGAFVVIIAMGIENKLFAKPMKIFSIVLMILAGALLFLINYTFVWYMVGIAGLCMFIYHIMPRLNSKSSIRHGFSIIAFVLLLVSFVSIVGAGGISRLVAGKPFYFVNNQPRPSVPATVSIIGRSYYHHPFVGAGVNRFNQAWEEGKSKILGGGIMLSAFWNSSFAQGTGMFFTLVATLGILGALLFIWFTILILFKNVFGLFAKERMEKMRPKDISIFAFLSFYAVVLFIFDSPSPIYFILIMAFFGILAAYITTADGHGPKSLGFVHDSRHSFFSILSVLIGVMLLALSSYGVANAYYAQYLANRASLLPADESGIQQGKVKITKALELSKHDAYARALVDIHLLDIAYLVQDNTKSEENLKSALQDNMNSAVESAKLAISIDPKNYQNYLAFLKVQETLMELGNTDVYQNAIEVGNQALIYSPNNPSILYRQAKAAAFTKHYADADIFIDKILAINPALIDAYLLRSQIAVSQGNPTKALAEIAEAEKVSPSNPTLLYQKGLLYFSQKSYSSAAETFERVIRIAPNSLETYSYLALSYEKLGRKESVISTLNAARLYTQDKDSIDALIEKVRNGGTLIQEDVSGVVDSETTEDDNKSSTEKEN